MVALSKQHLALNNLKTTHEEKGRTTTGLSVVLTRSMAAKLAITPAKTFLAVGVVLPKVMPIRLRFSFSR